ncbi:MAG: hypothetical protein J7L31_05935 [Thermoplasmata archaeon]|nr:hypothetical protein [Thermoplasmata archaeon]
MDGMDELREMMIRAQKELKDEEKMERFRKLRKEVVDAIMEGNMEPYDAYMKFLHEVNIIYPDAVNYFGTDHFEGKLRTYLLLWILKMMASPQDF